jgi:hypothetical protein
MTSLETFSFRFVPVYRLAGLPFGITPSTTEVVVNDGRLKIRFGPWQLETDLTNIIGVEVTGPYGFLKTAGPAHLSLADKGITFATNGDRGVCIRFRNPVPAIDPFHVISHPGATVTVTDIQRLAERLVSS